MAKTQQLKVFKCPFCELEAWFNKPHELAKHFHEIHLSEALNLLAESQKVTVKKSHLKWGLA